MVTAANDGFIKIYKADCEMLKNNKLEELYKIKCQGVINTMQLTPDYKKLAVVVSSENKLGRWTSFNKIKSCVKIFKLME